MFITETGSSMFLFLSQSSPFEVAIEKKKSDNTFYLSFRDISGERHSFGRYTAYEHAKTELMHFMKCFKDNKFESKKVLYTFTDKEQSERFEREVLSGDIEPTHKTD